jgi:hypothetical protein
MWSPAEQLGLPLPARLGSPDATTSAPPDPPGFLLLGENSGCAPAACSAGSLTTTITAQPSPVPVVLHTAGPLIAQEALWNLRYGTPPASLAT